MQVIKWDGHLPIEEPGIYSDIPMHIYHGQDICPGPSVSSGGLRRVLEVNGGSPAHFWNEWSGNKLREEQEDKQFFILGRAAHFMLLSMKQFRSQFAIREDQNPRWDSWRTDAAKEWREEMKAKGITCITTKDIDAIEGMQNSLADHPYVDLLKGEIERSIFWQDAETGLWIKNRPDSMPTNSADGCDLKTTSNVCETSIINAISDHAYHQQAALFRTAMRIVAKMELKTFSFFFVETKRPHCCRVVVARDRDLEMGERQNIDAMRLIVRCINEGHWPGPGEGHPSENLGLSDRYRKSAEQAIQYGDQMKGAYP